MRQLSWDLIGSGPPVVLIGGTNSTTAQTWGATVELLAKDHTLVMPQLPGTGASPLPDGELDAATIAGQLVRCALDAGFDRFAVAGASLGGPLALKVAALFPQHVGQVATLCGYAAPRAGLRMRLELWERLIDSGPEVIGRLLLVLGMPDATAEALPAEALQQMITMLGGDQQPGLLAQLRLARSIDVRSDLTTIAVPALVIAARQDNFVDPAHSQLIAESIPGSELLTLEGSHGLAHEAALDVAAAIARLVRSAP
ncbi:alpha/beta hydrolase [Kribbella sandramycini]|uniref:Alpha/beta hydrolase n=1 Tax=Kribbella sandramycini TaxID=60450 RepID=A0A7Y4L1R4_9ACTN|nr:alpha/beta hydrolase [Kribbella sandramycini]MBB6566633.1 pimeloyl-ACP methyl ester carboxylesterase [Kribbella sandramycini]NOL42712.1 alpha/beta hydrolase [Kribbella sandramycini]